VQIERLDLPRMEDREDRFRPQEGTARH
jgi:hypothetical protein